MPLKIVIRRERIEDTAEVSKLVRQAFTNGPRGYEGEAELICALRESSAYLPSLALVAESGSKVVGHILLTRVYIKTSNGKIPSLILAPVSVLPEYQGQGIGGQLIEASHQAARELGEKHVFLMGYATYYPRFGYKPSHEFGIVFPDGMDNDNCMAIELVTDGLKGIYGELEYSKPFYLL